MAAVRHDSLTGPAPIVRAVTVIMGTVVGLTFLFGFGNVLNLALRLGVPVWVAPLVRTGGGPFDPGTSAWHPASRAHRRLHRSATTGAPAADLRERGHVGVE